jgi:hypothetical protein
MGFTGKFIRSLEFLPRMAFLSAAKISASNWTDRIVQHGMEYAELRIHGVKDGI